MNFSCVRLDAASLNEILCARLCILNSQQWAILMSEMISKSDIMFGFML